MAASEKENELLSLAIVKTEEEKDDGGVLSAALKQNILMTSMILLYAVMFSTNFP